MAVTARRVVARLFAVAAGIACAVTLVSMIRSNQWWVRILDFPRVAEMLAIALIAVGCAVVLRRWRWPVLAALALAALWQGWRIYPYVPFAPVESTAIGRGRPIASTDCFRVLGLNVLQSNQRHAAVARLIARERPDVLLLMETDPGWARTLAPILRGYPHRLLRPLDNTYGMILASRLPVAAATMVDITDHRTPTVYARLATRSGRRFDYIGLHPRPPRPGQDTRRRDAKIMAAAHAFREPGVPVLAMGDFNDVAWSRTTQGFKHAGGFVDPRVGRGSYPTFPSAFIALGWPLDQLFLTPDLVSRSLRIGEDVGSDHRPLIADLCLAAPPRAAPAAAT